MKRRLLRPLRWFAIALLPALVWQPSAFAVDKLVLEVGAGHEGDLARIGAQWKLAELGWLGEKWDLGLMLEADIGTWWPEIGDTGLYDFGVMPVLQLSPAPNVPRSLVPFVEVGVGPHLLSNVRFSDLNLSTSLQFGSHIGVGCHVGKDGRFSLVYRFQHLSNASIKQPNPGIEFHLLQLGVRLSRRP